MGSQPHARKQLELELARAEEQIAALEAAEAALWRSQETLRRRLEIERLISRVSTLFLGTVDLNEAINTALRDIGSSVGADRSYVFLFDARTTVMNNTHEWCAKGVSPQIDSLQDLPIDLFPWWMTKLETGETIKIEDVSLLPKEAEAERETLESQDIKSLLVFPLCVRNALVGFVGLDNVKTNGPWSEDDTRLLRVASEILGQAIGRERVLRELWESEERFRGIVGRNFDAIAMLDVQGEVTFVSPTVERMTWYAPDELVGKHFREFVLGSDVSKVGAAFNRIAKNLEAVEGLRMTLVRKDGQHVHVESNSSPILKDGRIVGIQSIFRDITPRRQAEERSQRLIAELQKALATVKRLRGLLPICSSCKKIRDDKGYWTQVEQYLSDHAEVQFTHGLCPDCVNRLYPEMFDPDKGTIR